jgi:flagellar capping protein FliD
MAKAIMTVTPAHSFQGSQGLGAATDDLTTIQQFLLSLDSGVPPTAAELSAAKMAATALSTDIFATQTSSMPPAGTYNVKTTALVLGGVALVLGGASLAYLYKTSPKRRR